MSRQYNPFEPKNAMRCSPSVTGEFEAHEDGEGHSQDSDSGAPLSRRQALNVLGLEEGASEDEIVEAHRRLMQKLHPDRGGSSFLAAQINRAKDTLLRR